MDYLAVVHRVAADTRMKELLTSIGVSRLAM